MRNLHRIFFSLLLCAFVILQSGCTQSLSFKFEYDKGLKAYNEKDYDTAITSFTNALKYNPDSYSTYCLLGTSYGYKNETKEAHKVLTEALRKYPDEWNAYIFLGDLERSAKNFDAALEYYEKAVQLESMPADTKVYYQNVIQDVKKEENKYNLINAEPQEARLAKLLEEKKNSRKEIQGTAKQPAANDAQSSDVDDVVQLDWTVWENALTITNTSMSLLQYSKKGEDVKNYQWTELVTIQHYTPEYIKEKSVSEYLNSHIKQIQDVAKNAQKTFTKTVISESPNEIIYEWSFDGGSESEIARVVKNEKGLYHFHYAKKGIVAPDEKSKWLSVLKNAKTK